MEASIGKGMVDCGGLIENEKDDEMVGKFYLTSKRRSSFCSEEVGTSYCWYSRGPREFRSYALSWKPCQGDSLNLPDHRIHKDGDGDASFQLKSDSLPHAHAHSTKTFYKHQDSRIMKAQELKTKTSANSDINDNSSEIKLRGRLLESFQDDAKYEHVGQDTRSQGGKDVKDKQG
ncbi:hypothetical protein Tco_0191455 [Tanacetum coccineum]